MRKTADEAAAETERQRRIRRGRAVQAARRAALEIARGAQDAERQAENGEQADGARLRRLAAQEKLHEERRLARESEDARRRHRQVETEAQAAAQLALTSSTVSAAHCHAGGRASMNWATRCRRWLRSGGSARGREDRVPQGVAGGEHERQVADVGANGRRRRHVEAARQRRRRRRHALAEARRARQDAATAIRRSRMPSSSVSSAVICRAARRTRSGCKYMVSRELGGSIHLLGASRGSPNLTPRPCLTSRRHARRGSRNARRASATGCCASTNG